MTSSLGQTANGQKTTRSDPKILPGTVIYDVDLTTTLRVARRVVFLMPVRDTRRFENYRYVDLATVEALYGQNTDPLTFIVAQEELLPHPFLRSCKNLYRTRLAGTHYTAPGYAVLV